MFSNNDSKLIVHERLCNSLTCLINMLRNKAETKLVISMLILQFLNFSGLYFRCVCVIFVPSKSVFMSLFTL